MKVERPPEHSKEQVQEGGNKYLELHDGSIGGGTEKVTISLKKSKENIYEGRFRRGKKRGCFIIFRPFLIDVRRRR